ncbi:MAG: hypothetical protein PHC62_00130 [Candidatus Izemoplasmatales bacterium]|nr:hypothetical protein [Candidatus Izemoplasmatales bacterium]
MNRPYQPIWFEPDHCCPKCMMQKALIIYNRSNGQCFDYSEVLDSNQTKEFFDVTQGHTFSHMKCKYCGEEFFIDWTREVPRPMATSSYRNFIKKYRLTKLD